MKKLVFVLSMSVVILSACGEQQPSKTSGEDQVDEPVLNSGTETERDRAIDAPKDSLSTDTTKKN